MKLNEGYKRVERITMVDRSSAWSLGYIRKDISCQSIILLFGQQTEPPCLLLRPKNSHVNRRKIEK